LIPYAGAKIGRKSETTKEKGKKLRKGHKKVSIVLAKSGLSGSYKLQKLNYPAIPAMILCKQLVSRCVTIAE